MRELIEDRLYEFDSGARVELGPQIVRLDCTDENLDNKVTHSNYQKGSVDAYGNVIGSSSEMYCVDWKANLVPLVWKVYQFKKLQNDELLGAVLTVINEGILANDVDGRFVKVNEFQNKEDAFNFAKELG